MITTGKEVISLYDNTVLERLQHILLFKELEFSLKEIKDILDSTDEILLSLGSMYAGGGDFTTNIDKVGGEGTAVFADKAIQAYCKK